MKYNIKRSKYTPGQRKIDVYTHGQKYNFEININNNNYYY